MQTHNYRWIVLVSLSLVAGAVAAQERIGITHFQNDAVGAFPTKWRTFPGQGDSAREVYSVKEEGGNKFLSADDSKDISVQIFKESVWKIQGQPLVSWRWRARLLPKGANESSPATNDSACGVYVMFSRYRGIGLKYVWSSSLPVGTIHAKTPGKMYFVVLASGAKGLGKWQSHTVNVVADYEKAFGQPPSKDLEVSGIGVLTDGNAVHQPSACDYDDFVRSKVKSDASPAS